MNPRQGQEAGDDSVLYQAGRDIIQYGVSAQEAMEIARTIATTELLKYEASARDEAERRVAELREELIDRISSLDVSTLSAFREPDVQALLLEAQASYARSGREDVKRTLVDLIAARCKSETGGLQSIVIAEAIEKARRLSRGGIVAITASFILTRINFRPARNVAEIVRHYEENLAPFLNGIPTSEAEYDHIVATGCATLGIHNFDPITIMSSEYPGLFQSGIEKDELPEEISGLPVHYGVLTPCLHDQTKFQINAVGKADIDHYTNILGEEVGAAMRKLLDSKLLPGNEIEAKLRNESELYGKLIDTWRSNDYINSMKLTSVGKAIGHCNWANSMNDETPLSIWIPE